MEAGLEPQKSSSVESVELDLTVDTKKCTIFGQVPSEGPSIDFSDGCVSPRVVPFYESTCGAPVLATLGCSSRFHEVCPVCARKWRHQTQSRYYASVLAMKTPKFVTLTLRKSCGVEERLRDLWEMRHDLFRTLARRGYRIDSWVAMIEPPNHIHMVVDCEYLPKWELSEIWRRVTGDSMIVDIRAVNVQDDPASLLSYLTKYITKASTWDGSAYHVNLRLLKGFHLCGAWGLPPEVAKGQFDTCPNCGASPVWSRMSSGDYDACLRWYLQHPVLWGDSERGGMSTG